MSVMIYLVFKRWCKSAENEFDVFKKTGSWSKYCKRESKPQRHLQEKLLQK
jgi:hypothetical protein